MKFKLKQLLLLGLWLSATLATAQIKSIDLVSGLNYDYRLLSSDNANFSGAVDANNEDNKAKLNYLVGLNVSAKLIGKFDLKSGLRYTEIGYFYHKNKELSLSTGTSNSLSSSLFKNRYIEVPIALRINGDQNKKL